MRVYVVVVVYHSQMNNIDAQCSKPSGNVVNNPPCCDKLDKQKHQLSKYSKSKFHKMSFDDTLTNYISTFHTCLIY